MPNVASKSADNLSVATIVSTQVNSVVVAISSQWDVVYIKTGGILFRKNAPKGGIHRSGLPSAHAVAHDCYLRKTVLSAALMEHDGFHALPLYQMRSDLSLRTPAKPATSHPVVAD
jgi:hypothetical protein